MDKLSSARKTSETITDALKFAGFGYQHRRIEDCPDSGLAIGTRSYLRTASDLFSDAARLSANTIDYRNDAQTLARFARVCYEDSEFANGTRSKLTYKEFDGFRDSIAYKLPSDLVSKLREYDEELASFD